MAAGDITVLGPFDPNDKTTIDTALTGQVLVADLLCSYPNKSGQVFFVIVKAA